MTTSPAEPLDDLYCFSLYCEGHGVTKSKPFATIRPSAEEATAQAFRVWLEEFPQAAGWCNHQVALLLIPRDRILQLVQSWSVTPSHL